VAESFEEDGSKGGERKDARVKICPECRTKNDDLDHFCKKCGFLLSNSSLKEKRDKVLAQKRLSRMWIVFIIAVFALGGAAFWIIEGKTTTHPKIASQQKVMEGVDYSGKTISMTDIEARAEGGKISIPLDVLKEKKMVRFEYEGHGVKVPLLAYVTPDGRVVTAISMCEPCRSTRFHIEGKTIVCDTCATEWDLETLKGIKGGCVNYPPQVISSTVEKDRIVIEEKAVLDWKPRA
jgi:uncharacterized membrane protein